MAVKIVKVDSRRELRHFIHFPHKLYRNEPNWCPALERGEFKTFSRQDNGAFRFCDADCFLAYKDGRLCGRVAAIINTRANEKDGCNIVRFGWFDAIDDQEVADALVETVAAWGRVKGCTLMKGPLGFTNMDKEGLLVEGFDKMSPFTSLYNFPYYDRLLTTAGMVKDCDWIQRSIDVSGEMPPMYSFAPTIEKKFGLHMAEPASTRELARKYGMDIFHMYNESFAPLYAFSPLDDDQIRNYLDTYVPILNKDYVSICLDADERPVGFAFCVPSLAKAVRDSGGRMFPFGFLRVMKALHRNDTIEALLIGVKPEFQGKGASVLILKRIHESCIRNGIKTLLVNPQLEDNFKAVSLFEQYDPQFYMRRRTYRCPL